MKVTLLWRVGWAGFTNVAGNTNVSWSNILSLLIVVHTSGIGFPPASAALFEKKKKEPIFSSLALFWKLIRTRDQRVGQPACELGTVGYFHLFITHTAILALTGGDLNPDRTTTFLSKRAILVTSSRSYAEFSKPNACPQQMLPCIWNAYSQLQVTK